MASPLYQFDQAQLKLNTNEEKSILNTLDKNAPIENIKEEKAVSSLLLLFHHLMHII